MKTIKGWGVFWDGELCLTKLRQLAIYANQEDASGIDFSGCEIKPVKIVVEGK